MMWIFAIVVVLAMGGVAAVAVGRGEPMAEEHADHAPVLVPADGPVTRDDLGRVRFPLAFRGYRMADVDALLDRLAGQLDDGAVDVAEPDAVPVEALGTVGTVGDPAAQPGVDPVIDPAAEPAVPVASTASTGTTGVTAKKSARVSTKKSAAPPRS